MADQFAVPEEYEISLRRILPYLAAPLQNNLQVLDSLLLYLKLGGEKLARIAIDAMNVTQRLQDAEVRKQLREQELLDSERQEDLEDDDDDSEKQDDADAADDDDFEDDAAD